MKRNVHPQSAGYQRLPDVDPTWFDREIKQTRRRGVRGMDEVAGYWDRRKHKFTIMASKVLPKSVASVLRSLLLDEPL